METEARSHEARDRPRVETDEWFTALRADMEEGFRAICDELRQALVNAFCWSMGATIIALVATTLIATALMVLHIRGGDKVEKGLI